MPKGSLLHAHIGGAVDFHLLLDLALKQPAMHVRVPKPLTKENITSILPEFLALPRESYNPDNTNITSGDYVPNTWVNISKARESFSPSLGGPKGFDKWVIDGMVLHPSDAYGTHNTVSKVFCRFINLHRDGLTSLPKIWEKFKSTSLVTRVSQFQVHHLFLTQLCVGLSTLLPYLEAMPSTILPNIDRRWNILYGATDRFSCR
jgi:adenosine deaminase CECR1